MKIVIDIPEKIYNRYINYTESYIDFVFVGTEEILVKAIRNGTPLPKGHGDLIDRDELKKVINEFDYYDQVLDAPTIIEADADKESD